MKANFIIQEDKEELVSQAWDQRHRLSAHSLDEGSASPKEVSNSQDGKL